MFRLAQACSRSSTGNRGREWRRFFLDGLLFPPLVGVAAVPAHRMDLPDRHTRVLVPAGLHPWEWR